MLLRIRSRKRLRHKHKQAGRIGVILRLFALSAKLRKDKELAKKELNEYCDKLNFEDVYTSLHLNTVHRFFSGTDSSFIALFYMLEFLHNFKDFVNFVNRKEQDKEWAKKWYGKWQEIISNIDKQEKFKEWENNNIVGGKPVRKDYIGSFARPEVYNYVFKRKWMSKRKKKKILAEARTEFMRILTDTGMKYFIESSLINCR